MHAFDFDHITISLTTFVIYDFVTFTLVALST